MLALSHDTFPRGERIGADDPVRTDDLRITNALLCQLSYVGSWW